MTSKNLFSKLVRQNLTRSLWAVTLAALGCLTALTLPVVFTIQQYYENLAALQRDPTSWSARPGLTAAESLLQSMSESVSFVVSFDNPLLKLVLIVLAILCGVAMFRYLHDKRQVDFYHALPISRGRLFLVQYVTGVAAVIPVYLIVLLLTLAACSGGSKTADFDVQTAMDDMLSAAPISRIYTNGPKAHQLYKRHLLPRTGCPAICLPSTSPANASCSLERLVAAWRCVAEDW